ncbi:unnamed protein product [Sphenostylis stenocarpa]|uniref:Uncharacterized protein n=1 Tax=Sphenostylis stenocarpa TaxID=92480 RepID=A0AA86SPQ0_9FABA|nr:unnamed protein product [Sphenostylis stenocarpa]
MEKVHVSQHNREGSQIRRTRNFKTKATVYKTELKFLRSGGGYHSINSKLKSKSVH